MYNALSVIAAFLLGSGQEQPKAINKPTSEKISECRFPGDSDNNFMKSTDSVGSLFDHDGEQDPNNADSIFTANAHNDSCKPVKDSHNPVKSLKSEAKKHSAWTSEVVALVKASEEKSNKNKDGKRQRSWN